MSKDTLQTFSLGRVCDPDVCLHSHTRARKCMLTGRDIQACNRLDTHIHLHAEACVFPSDTHTHLHARVMGLRDAGPRQTAEPPPPHMSPAAPSPYSSEHESLWRGASL